MFELSTPALAEEDAKQRFLAAQLHGEEKSPTMRLMAVPYILRTL